VVAFFLQFSSISYIVLIFAARPTQLILLDQTILTEYSKEMSDIGAISRSKLVMTSLRALSIIPPFPAINFSE
jgi:hypothetical protein